MASTTSPNMSLIIPTVGAEPGPTYAQDINNSLTRIDAHDHTSGNGVQITPQGLNINSQLTLVGAGGQIISNIAALTLAAQSSTPVNSSLYATNNLSGDLYYVNAAGLAIQITNSSGVAGSPGSIANLTSPASASYVSAQSTFVWKSNTNLAANMDFGSAVMRNLSPNSTYALTLSPPATLSSNYTLTLPTIPGASAFLTLDSSGNMAGSVPLSGGITGANLAAATVTGAKIATATVTNSNLAAVNYNESFLCGPSGSGVFSNTSGSYTAVFDIPVAINTVGRPVQIFLIADPIATASGGSTGHVDANGSTAQAFFQLQRDSVSIGQISIATSGTFITCAPAVVSFFDTAVAAGTHTYQLLGRVVAGTSCTVVNCRMIVREL